jgi:hypothetical protein
MPWPPGRDRRPGRGKELERARDRFGRALVVPLTDLGGGHLRCGFERERRMRSTPIAQCRLPKPKHTGVVEPKHVGRSRSGGAGLGLDHQFAVALDDANIAIPANIKPRADCPRTVLIAERSRLKPSVTRQRHFPCLVAVVRCGSSDSSNRPPGSKRNVGLPLDAFGSASTLGSPSTLISCRSLRTSACHWRSPLSKPKS